MQHREAEQAKKHSSANRPLVFCLQIGLAGGVIWGLVRWLAVAMNLTNVPQAFLIDPWVKRSALTHAVWQLSGFAAFILMSIVAAIVYYVICRSFRGPLPGLLFGIGWWTVVYALAGPVVGAMPPLRQIGLTSLITDFCLFAVWGLFIGYSIAFEYHDETGHEPKPAPT